MKVTLLLLTVRAGAFILKGAGALTCHGVLGGHLPLDGLEESSLCVVEEMFPHVERLKQETEHHDFSNIVKSPGHQTSDHLQTSFLYKVLHKIVFIQLNEGLNENRVFE